MSKKSPASSFTESSAPLAANLFLVSVPVNAQKATTVTVTTPTNHIIVIDCSGSMGGDLPRIRAQLKAKLPKLLKQDDTLSLVWFSGKGECGTLLKAETVDGLKDLQTVNQAIDRWLKPTGMTGFKDPLLEVAKLTADLAKSHPGPNSLFFLTDGCENQWSKPDVFAALSKAVVNLSSATFVEYGYYADRQLLASMAEKAGGALIFSETFDKFEPAFDAAMNKRTTGKRVEVPVNGDPVGGFAFAMHDGDLLTFEATSGKVQVPEDISAVYYLSPKGVGDRTGSKDLNACYAALSLYATRMKSDVVYAILKTLGDVAFIDQYVNCFGKQAYSAFTDAAKTAAFDLKRQFTKGVDYQRVPKEDAFTVLDLLALLANDEQNRVLLDHPDFQYNRISRGRVDSDENFSSAEQSEFDDLSAELAGLAGKKGAAARTKEIAERLSVLTENKKTALHFTPNPAPDGYALDNLVYNEDRPNISIKVRKEGYVDLSARLLADMANGKLKEKENSIPAKQFPTFIYRNYAIVKDGLVNVERLPVRLSLDTQRALAAANVPGLVQQLSEHDLKGRMDGSTDVLLNLKALPIINRKMTKEVSAKTLFNLEWGLVKARCAQKVFNTYAKELRGELAKAGDTAAVRSKGYRELYGAEAATWLAEQGLTDFSGFAPKMVQAEATDVYVGKELTVQLKGYSTIPSVSDVKERMEKVAEFQKTGKGRTKSIEGVAALMVPLIERCEKYIDHPSKRDSMALAWFENQAKQATTDTRALILGAANIKFGVVVGQVWFSEWKSLDENTMEMELTGPGVKDKVLGTITMKEVEIRI